MNQTILTVVGARPQLIKAAPVSSVLFASGIREILVHTGQHYDDGMSAVFFRELGIPDPDHYLGLGGGTHGQMTGRMMERLEELIIDERPNTVLVYGDTNSTLAGALAAAKLNIPVVHVEAGLRSFNHAMPEEINRICVDHVSSLLFCSSEVGAHRLREEGIRGRIEVVGDVMADVFQATWKRFKQDPNAMGIPQGRVFEGEFDLLTLHRADTASDASKLGALIEVLANHSNKLVFPVHPRSRKLIENHQVPMPSEVHLIDPVGYLGMVSLLARCRRVFTDSGGLQKEAYWAKRQCMTLRTETEWVETLKNGWNQLVGVDPKSVAEAMETTVAPGKHPVLYGDGMASDKIVRIMMDVAII